MYNAIENKYKDMKEKHDVLLVINEGLTNELKNKNEDDDLQKALKMSGNNDEQQNEDDQMQKALKMSVMQ